MFGFFAENSLEQIQKDLIIYLKVVERITIVHVVRVGGEIDHGLFDVLNDGRDQRCRVCLA